MIGTLNNKHREVTVIGAGIAGLLAAYALDRRGFRVTLLEEKKRAGGLINTRKFEYGIAEAAAHSFLASTVVSEVCNDLGVELLNLKKEGRAKFIFRNGKPRQMPLTPFELVGALARAATVRANDNTGSLSLEQWAKKFIGDAGLRYMFTPFVRGIYGAEPANISVAAAFPELSVEHGRTLIGSLIRRSRNNTTKREPKRRMAPRNGMVEVVEKLERRMEERLGNRFRRAESVKSIPDAPNVILSVPAFAAARLIDKHSPALAERLQAVDYSPFVSVTAFVSRTSLPKDIRGTGVLMPAVENRRSLGILYNSSSFDYRVEDESKVASFTVMMGGSSQPAWVSASDATVEEAVRAELSEVVGLRGEPLQLVTHRWRHGIPQYSPALPAIWNFARATWCSQPGRMLFGNYTGQVSIRGMIESAMGL